MGVRDYLRSEEEVVYAYLNICVIYAHVDALAHLWNFYDALNVLSQKFGLFL